MAARLEERITVRLPTAMLDGLRGAATLHGRDSVAAELRIAAAAWIDATASAMQDERPGARSEALDVPTVTESEREPG